jgi:hypothetical protein
VKTPRVSFSPASIRNFLVDHGEKVGFAAVGAFALLLSWWGIDAVRTQAVKPDRRPDAVASLATQATANIDNVRKVPPQRLPSRAPLPPAIDPWRPQQVKIAAAPAGGALLNRPLVAEMSKRSKPDVLPIEDLQAVAGIAVLPDTKAPAGGAEFMPRQPDLAPPPEEDPRRRTPRGKQQPRGRDAPVDGSPFGLGGGLSPELTPPVAGGSQPSGKITPFVVVTGLIPTARQQQEFERRFGSASFRDPQRDRPQWAVYLVERARVAPGGTPRWERLAVPDAARPDAGGRIGTAEFPGGVGAVDQQPIEPEPLPPAFFLGPDQSAVSYAAPLPQRIDEPWGAVGVHPWFLPKLSALRRAGGGNPEAAGGAIAKATLQELVGDAKTRAGKEVRLEAISLDPEPERQGDAGLYTFGVRASEPAATVAIGTIGVGTAPVFAVSEQWARQLSVDGTTSEPRACNVRCRVDLVGKTPVIRILEIEFLDEQGAVTETRQEPAPQRVDAGEGMVLGGGQPARGDFGQGGESAAGAENRLFRFVDTSVKPGESYRYRVKLAVRNPNVGLASRHLADLAAAKGEFLVSNYSQETPAVRVPEPMTIVARTIDKDTKRKMKVKGESLEVMILAPSQKTGNYSLRSMVTDLGGLANVSPELNKPSDIRHYGESLTSDHVLVDSRGSQDDRAEIRSAAPPEPLEMLFLRPDGSFAAVSAADGERQIKRYGPTLFKPGTQLPDDGRPDRKDKDRDEPSGLPAEGLR